MESFEKLKGKEKSMGAMIGFMLLIVAMAAGLSFTDIRSGICADPVQLPEISNAKMPNSEANK